MLAFEQFYIMTAGQSRNLTATSVFFIYLNSFPYLKLSYGGGAVADPRRHHPGLHDRPDRVDMTLRALGREAGDGLLEMIDGLPVDGVVRRPCLLVVRQSSVGKVSEHESVHPSAVRHVKIEREPSKATCG